MECREVQRKINTFLNDEMNEKELASFLQHVKSCPLCYDELEVTYTVFSVIQILDDRNGDSDLLKELDHKIAEKENWLRQQHKSRIFKRTVLSAACVSSIFLAFSAFMFFRGDAAPKRQLYTTSERSFLVNMHGQGRAVDDFLYIKQGGRVYLVPPKSFEGTDIFDSSKHRDF